MIDCLRSRRSGDHSKNLLQNGPENVVFGAVGVGRKVIRKTVVYRITRRAGTSLGARFREFLRWSTVKQKQGIPERIHYLSIHYPNHLSST